MARSLLRSPPDPTRGDPIQARIDHLVDLARQRGAQAVIFHGIKFCEPEQFDLPQLRRGLEQAGLRCLDFEVDLCSPVSHQVVTRIEALMESLR